MQLTGRVNVFVLLLLSAILVASAGPAAGGPLLRVDDLKIHFPVRDRVRQTLLGTVKAVDGVSFELREGETVLVTSLERLADDRGHHRVARAVRHRRDEAGDGGKRRGLALAPADLAAGGHADDAGVLAAVADILDDGHREIEEVDRVDGRPCHGLRFLRMVRPGASRGAQGARL